MIKLIDTDTIKPGETLKEVLCRSPEQVMCKDCIYYHPFDAIKGKGECHIVEDAECLTWYEDCDYCSYGKKKKQEGED